MGGPGTLQAARYGVFSVAFTFGVHPTEALVFDRGAFRTGAQHGRVAVAVRLTHGVTAGRQGNGFFVVHGHAFERGAHVLGCAQGVGFAIHTLGVDIDQAHLYGGQRIFQGIPLFIVSVALFGGG